MSAFVSRSFRSCAGLLLLQLVVGGVGPALEAGQPAVQVAAPSSTAPEEPFPADERLEIPAIHNTLRVAEPNEIPIAVHGSELKTILTEQRTDGEDPYGMEGGEQTLDLLHHADASTYVNIVPIRLGKLTIRYMANFADGGYASQLSPSSGTIENQASRAWPIWQLTLAERALYRYRATSSEPLSSGLLQRQEGTDSDSSTVRDL